MKTKPLNNLALIEVLRDDDGVSRTDATESMRYGLLVEAHMEPYHLTASSAIQFDQAYIACKQEEFKTNQGKIVRWEEFAEAGQTFEEDGKTYALVPWWRLTSYEETK